MELNLKLTGCLLIGLACIHVAFPKYFNWRKELVAVSLINQQMMQVHTFFIALVVFLMGVLCISCADDIVQTTLGHRISLGLFVFWFARLVFQFFVYSSTLWRGKRFETIIHILLSLLWIYFSVVFLFVYLG